MNMNSVISIIDIFEGTDFECWDLLTKHQLNKIYGCIKCEIGNITPTDENRSMIVKMLEKSHLISLLRKNPPLYKFMVENLLKDEPSLFKGDDNER